MKDQTINIDEDLVRKLIANQFPEWKNLPVSLVSHCGWDNKTFHLGDNRLVRLPSSIDYATQVEKEQRWLPKLASLLPLAIPTPLAIGQASDEYPWRWSIYRWIIGETAAIAPISNLCDFAKTLAEFLVALQQIDTTDAPLAGPDNFYRGGSLAHYDTDARQAIALLKDNIDSAVALAVWESGLVSTWEKLPVWVHGDISAGNLLVREGQLSAVIDFGQLAIGDPACDLMIAWTLFSGKSRELFRSILSLDNSTWARARAWTLWKFLMVAARMTGWNAVSRHQAMYIVNEVLAEHLENH